jgi:mRNA-degrading endonuclease YafQ of YafQ-DinJ toxin-antitoxin module
MVLRGRGLLRVVEEVWMSSCLGFGGKVYKPLPYTSIGVGEVSEKTLKTPEKTEDVQAAANSSACSSNEGCVSAEEFGVSVNKKVIKWAEDLVDLPNNYCPHCGKGFWYDDEVAEVSGDLVIVFHYKCFKEVFEEGDR